MSSQTSTAVGVVVAILIVGAIATLGYYQFEVAGKQTTSSTATVLAVTCPSSACVDVNMTNSAATNPPGFAPDTVKVVIGENNTVYWTNSDNIGTPHTVTPKTGPAGGWTTGSGILDHGDTYQYTFTVPGTYTYYCTLHPTVMSGTVVVVAASSSTAASTTTTPSS